jgi:spore coat protein U-like protein
VLNGLRLAGVMLGTACAVCGAPAAAKSTASNTLKVDLVVGSTCNLTTNPLQFGTATSRDKTKTASTTMTFKCTPLTAYTVTIDNGKYFDGTTRRMFGGQAQGQVWYVDYQLYRDAAHLLPWNSSLAGTAVGVVPLSGQQTLTLYGEAQLKNVRAAPYLDTVTVTLDF